MKRYERSKRRTNLRWKIRDDYYSSAERRVSKSMDRWGEVNLKALAVTPFLVEITVGPRVAFLRFVACLPIRSGDLVKQRGLNRPFMRTGGSWRGNRNFSVARRDLIRCSLDLSQSIRSPIKTTPFRKQLVSFLFIRTSVETFLFQVQVVENFYGPTPSLSSNSFAATITKIILNALNSELETYTEHKISTFVIVEAIRAIYFLISNFVSGWTLCKILLDANIKFLSWQLIYRNLSFLGAF